MDMDIDKATSIYLSIIDLSIWPPHYSNPCNFYYDKSFTDLVLQSTVSLLESYLMCN